MTFEISCSLYVVFHDCFESVRSNHGYHSRTGISQKVYSITRSLHFFQMDSLFNLYVKITMYKQEFDAKFRHTYNGVSVAVILKNASHRFLDLVCQFGTT